MTGNSEPTCVEQLPSAMKIAHAKVLRQLLADEQDLMEVAGAVSGASGIVALTETHLLFYWRLGALSGIRVTRYPRSEIEAAEVQGADFLVSPGGKAIRFAQVSPPEVAENIVSELRSDGAASSVEIASDGAARGALRLLPPKSRALADQNIGPEENVHVCLVGAGGQALVALDDRLLLVKTGFMAGATFGGKAATFPYDQVTGIEMHFGAATGVLAVQTPSYQGILPHSYWTQDRNHDPWKLPNCIPIARNAAKTFPPYLQMIRNRIDKGYWEDGIGESGPPSVQSSPTQLSGGDSLADQLKTLTELHGAGALSDEEFAQAKGKLLAQ
ncbi:MAG: SHOCT domain-containing protein [Armatimonadota bacterium]